ncbi:MAG TPA: glutathione S-transferase family protein [Croceibacterium sp.]|nr:glutathione S-transferase family protein [Croceibacterium sp.]
MKIYGFPLSPFVRKVVVAAREKGLEYDLIPANPSQPTEEFLKVSPFSKIPAIEDGEFCLADSTAIVTYLDAKYPEPALFPADPEARGRAVWFEEVSDTVLVPAGAPIVVNRFLRPKIFGTDGDEAAALAGEEAIRKPLGYLESAVSDSGWLDWNYSIGDIAVACTIKTLSYTGWTLDAATYPKLAAWYGRVTERAAWQQAADEEDAVFASMKG